MHCSSCERALDRYAEGTLRAPHMRAVREHLRACEHCQSLYTELKVLDALLLTASSPSLAPNFTFAVMANVRSAPAPKPSHHRLWSFLALYSTAGWVALVIWYALFGAQLRPLAARAAHAAASLGTALASAFGAAAQVASHNPTLFAAIALALVADAGVALAVLALHRAAVSARSEAA